MPESAEPFDIGAMDDSEDIDFVHHPSYQDRAGANNNRRRRRRRLDEPLPKEESISKGSSRPITLPQTKSELVTELDSVGRDSPLAERSSGFSVSVSEVAPFIPASLKEKELGVTGRSSVSEPGERVAKPQLVKSSRETEPPEVIAIEMTPEEQDVYALMGISPLVRLERQLKNPKSVILSVVLPGEGNQTQTSNEPPLESPTSVPVLSLASDEAEIPESEFATSLDVAPSSDEVQMPENVLVTLPDEEPVTELSVDPAQTDESDSSRPIVRRRRRRSSAADSED